VILNLTKREAQLLRSVLGSMDLCGDELFDVWNKLADRTENLVNHGISLPEPLKTPPQFINQITKWIEENL